jgi:hypothetical protein
MLFQTIGLWTFLSQLNHQMYSYQNYESLAEYYTDYYIKQVNDITTVVVSNNNTRVTHPSIMVKKPTDHLKVDHLNIRLIIMHLVPATQENPENEWFNIGKQLVSKIIDHNGVVKSPNWKLPTIHSNLYQIEDSVTVPAPDNYIEVLREFPDTIRDAIWAMNVLNCFKNVLQ